MDELPEGMKIRGRAAGLSMAHGHGHWYVHDYGRICGRCYDAATELFTSGCLEKPESLAGQPLGQYHCPDCGAMVVAGARCVRSRQSLHV